MPDRDNFLLGYGERLTERILPPSSASPKTHPYTFSEAQQRLAPRVTRAVADLTALPAVLCPHDETVALVTLHPTYVAKSYYPAELLRVADFRAIGSRARELQPEKSTRKEAQGISVTTELFVAGPRSGFRDFAMSVQGWTQQTQGAKDLVKIEDFRAVSELERLKPLPSPQPEPLLEIVLHASDRPDAGYIIEGFEAYLSALGIRSDLDRRFYVEGLCFLPVRVPRPLVEDVTKYSFLRLAREMPSLRPFRPISRGLSVMNFPCTLPAAGPVDPSVRVAVFDGGLPTGSNLHPWVSSLDGNRVSAPMADFTSHGLAVTSALLFGPLKEGQIPERPPCHVDHYRVLDVDTEADDQSELFTVLGRIQDVLDNNHYQFINLSLGPRLPVEDNDVHVWTAVLDRLLGAGDVLASIAVGNDGQQDRASGNARIQTPSDCVNGLSIGACDSQGSGWSRAAYSSIGPGRSSGIVKPDALAFGGSSHEPYWVLDAGNTGYAMPIHGTSFAAPTALRTAVAIRSSFGDRLTPLTLKALLIHNCENGGHDKPEVGWGRIATAMEEIVLCDDRTANIVYQGTLSPAEWLRVPIPMPASVIAGMVTLRATLCFATSTDPQDPVNYTRSGLEVRFRPDESARKDPAQQYADTKTFFRAREFHLADAELRTDAHRWETTLTSTKKMRGSSLNGPVFDIHYTARSGGHSTTTRTPLPYALIVTVHSPNTPDLYNRIATRYRTQLEILQPVIQIPINV